MAIITTAMVPTGMVRPHKLAAAAAAGSVALLIGGIAILSFRAAVNSLPVDEVIGRLREGEPISDAQRIAAARASVRAGMIFDRGRYFTNAALAAGPLTAGQQRQALHGLSMAVLIDQALETSPASPHNWVRRASIQLAAGDRTGARASIDTSLLLGRFVPGLTVPRLKVMLNLRQLSPDPALDSEIANQMRVAARSEPGDLAIFADGGAAEGLAQRTLYTDFALYRAYLTSLKSVRDARAAAELEQKR